MHYTVDRESCIRQLLDDHGDHLLRICMVYVRRRQYAEDAVQETYIKAFTSRKTMQIKDFSQQRAWLTRIAINTCKDMLRKPDFQNECKNFSPDAPPQTFSHQEYDLLSVIQTLPVEQREVLVLYYYQQLRMDEIAKLLHVAKATVHYRLNKAKNTLRIRLERSDDDE